MRKSFTIHDLPKDERPRERMLKSGAHNLTDKELLVTLLGRGINGESVMITAQRLWGRFRNIKRIANASIEELTQVKGIATFSFSNTVNPCSRPHFLQNLSPSSIFVPQFEQNIFLV